MYDRTVYHQKKDTAMGTRADPFYVYLFMGRCEALHFMSNNSFISKIILYKRYIDDLFILWASDEKDALDFINLPKRDIWCITRTLN